MEFRLTYAGPLLAHSERKRLPERSLHVHELRKQFHLQLKNLWKYHPILTIREEPPVTDEIEIFSADGFRWQPLVTKSNGLICKLDVLMLRGGSPGGVLADIDNRLKTLFDALRRADGPEELGAGTSQGQQTAAPDEDPFYVLLEDDRLITHIAVATETLLQPVPNYPPDNAVRLVIGVTARPYHAHMDNLDFA